MAQVTGWGECVANTLAAIAAIVPTVDSGQPWRLCQRSRAEGQGGRDREFNARRWKPISGVRVFGGGEDQLGRDLLIEVWYTPTDDEGLADRTDADSADLVAALEPQSTYPAAGAWGALHARIVLRDQIDEGEPTETGAIRVTYPVRLIWREPVSHV